MQLTPEQRQIQVGFLEYLFGTEVEGFICICTAKPDMTDFSTRFLSWPSERSLVPGLPQADRHVWFCTSLLSDKRRVKSNCMAGSFAWADLDAVNPTDISPRPSVAIESSPGRYQAFWRVAETLPGEVLEDFSRRIAYSTGADRSGWPLTKLLRLPYTYNFKPEYDNTDPPVVDFVPGFQITDTRVPVSLLDAIPAPSPEQIQRNGHAHVPTIEFGEIPNREDLPESSQVIYAYRNQLTESAFHDLFSLSPSSDAEEDWSKRLWRLEKICAEVGMNPVEIFSVAIDAACNKYKRDNRPISFLWREVNKAWADSRTVAAVIEGTNAYTELRMPELVDPDEASSLEEDSFLKDYKRYATESTDAPMIYHELSCFMALSALVADKLRVETNFGSMPPNLWGLLLGKSSLSRKTTAMKLAMNIVQEIDPEIIVATQAGSPEGLLTAMSLRPAKTSMFFKDEVSGFFESINKREYLTGYTELLTELYDAPKVPLTRPLRNATITVVEPYFVFFGGGITEKVHANITEPMIEGGFLPRFLVVASDIDIDELRPVGPPTEAFLELKQKVVEFFHSVYAAYDQEIEHTMETPRTALTFKSKKRFEARLSSEAWDLWNSYEKRMVQAGSDSHISHLALPMFQRLAFSLLKMSLLVAVSRRSPVDGVLLVDENDVKQAAWYTQRWGTHSVDLIANANKPKLERILEKVHLFITNNPLVLRSEVSQRFRLNKRDMGEVEETLVMRGLIDKRSEGKAVKYVSTI